MHVDVPKFHVFSPFHRKVANISIEAIPKQLQNIVNRCLGQIVSTLQ